MPVLATGNAALLCQAPQKTGSSMAQHPGPSQLKDGEYD